MKLPHMRDEDRHALRVSQAGQEVGHEIVQHPMRCVAFVLLHDLLTALRELVGTKGRVRAGRRSGDALPTVARLRTGHIDGRASHRGDRSARAMKSPRWRMDILARPERRASCGQPASDCRSLGPTRPCGETIARSPRLADPCGPCRLPGPTRRSSQDTRGRIAPPSARSGLSGRPCARAAPPSTDRRASRSEARR